MQCKRILETKVFHRDGLNYVARREYYSAVSIFYRLSVWCLVSYQTHYITATECHLPYGTTQCYLSPNASEHTLPSPQPDRLVLDLPTPKGWKAELT